MQNPLFPTDPTEQNNSQDLPDYLQTGSAATPTPQQVSPLPGVSATPQPAQPFPGASQQQPANSFLATAGPSSIDTASSSEDAAVNLIRRKVAAIYADEPDAQQELNEVNAIAATPTPLSPHQQYMQNLQASGRSPAEVTVAWHEYYQGLSDQEKHQVWQEFYAASQTAAAPQPQIPRTPQAPLPQVAQQASQHATANPADAPWSGQPAMSPTALPTMQAQLPATAGPFSAANSLAPVQTTQTTSPYDLSPAHRTPAAASSLADKAQRAKDSAKQTIAKHKDKAPTLKELKKKVTDTVSAQGKLQKSDHLKSLLFGLGTGAVVVFIFLFSFFNEVFLSPFIQPSRTAAETPVIVDPASVAVGTTPKVIIPKINVEIPTDYTIQSADNKTVEAALDNGIVHYPTTVRPGQAGNTVFFGHSSNNIFNPGKYKFAFVLLHKLVEGDTFYLTYEGKTYAYQVITRRVVEPTEVGVLGPVEGQTATATLITCDPPGTSLKRLVVVGKQISPDPAGNGAPPAPGTPGSPPVQTATATQLAGNGPTLWGRLWSSIF